MSTAAETAFEPAARFQREIQRALQRNIKGWEYLSSPGRAGGVSARTLVWKRGTMNLFHYEPLADEIYRTPLMLVMATSNPSYVFDLLPGQSLVEFLLQRGHDLYVLEWTPPAIIYHGNKEVCRVHLQTTKPRISSTKFSSR